MAKIYNHKKIESKWQNIWQKKKAYKTLNPSTGSGQVKKRKYYVLDMFPYPSGAGLHVGHPKGYIGSDVFARMKRMQGYNVLHPMGYDAFGLPAEQYAIEHNINPRQAVEKNVATFEKQLSKIGLSYDWERRVNTTDPGFYKWTQWIFLKIYGSWYNRDTNKAEPISKLIKIFEKFGNANVNAVSNSAEVFSAKEWKAKTKKEKQDILMKYRLAYEGKAQVNWCPKLGTVLANDEVVDGKDGLVSERGGYPVVQKTMRQWFMRITAYADRLLSGLDGLDWSTHIKEIQKNWIGKSEGAEIEFELTYKPSSALTEGNGEFGYHTTDPENFKLLHDKALEMRKNPTIAEKKLWEILRKIHLTPALSKGEGQPHPQPLSKGEGENANPYRFRRQHIIDKFIVDFVCLSKNLIIEVDGDIHDYQKERDEERTKILKLLGFQVLRFKNEEVLKNPEAIIEKISVVLRALSLGEGRGEVFGQSLGEVGSIKIFTTRTDTLFGVTFLALAPEVAKKITGKDFGIQTDTDRDNKEKIGVDTGLKAKNPANGEMIPVFAVNYVSADYGTGAVMGVPAHDERDFEFAKMYDLPIKYVVAPYTYDRENPPRADKKDVPRKAVKCFVYNPKDGTYLCIEWNKNQGVDWKTIVSGGVEEDEDMIEAGKREVEEETGYKNLKFVKYLGVPERVDFYHPPKDENRLAEFYGLLFELQNEEQSPVDSSESARHFYRWIKEEEVLNFINHGRMFFERILNNDIGVYAGHGKLINSGQFADMDSEKAKKEITQFVGGKIVTNYKMRDAIFARQRYWGEPIPLIYDKDGIIMELPEKKLPLKLPSVKSYQPTGTGESPLASVPAWVKSGYETNTMPGWAGSSWYFLRYMDPKNKKAFADKNAIKYWKNVDMYVGGQEHATGHLLYSRFWHKFLKDYGLVVTEEPFQTLRNQGMILGTDNRKMSKRWGNVINPDDVVKTYGADTLRVYEMFMGPFDASLPWSTDNIIGSRRFLEKVWRLAQKVASPTSPQPSPKGREKLKTLSLGEGKGEVFEIGRDEVERLLHKTIKKVTEDIESFAFNTAISSMMIFVNEVEKNDFQLSTFNFKTFLRLLAPFAPHMTEELWSMLGEKRSINLSLWPSYDKELIKDKEIKIVVQINSKVRTEIMVEADEGEESIKDKILSNEIVIKYLAGNTLKRFIYVKNKLVNIVF